MQEQQRQQQLPQQPQLGSHPSPSVFRPIAPLPHALSPVLTPNLPSNLASCTVSPLPSPQTKPNPNQGRMLPFETPPVSPFSNPMTHDLNQPPFRLPPPLKQLPIPGQQQQQQQQQPQPYSQQLVSPTNCTNPANTANASLGSQQAAQASPTKYERILPKGPSTSVFSIPITPGLNSNSGGARPIMQHHTSVIHPPVPPHGHRLSTGDRPMSTADQRELARKTSHSAIERRRRERINDKIMQLKELIPSCAEQDHLHKLNILQSAIEYIQYLQDVITDQREAKSDSRSEESRPTKRSKFDRYEIPNRRSNVSETRGDRLNDDKPKQKVSTNDTAPAADPEDAKVLLMLSADSKAELPARSPQRSSASSASLPMLQPQTRECSTQTPSEWVPKRSIASHGTNADGEVVEEQQTSTKVSDRMQEDDDEIEEEEEQPPRRSMTIQQLLLQDTPTQTDD